jgi:hypothetical protein
MDEDPREDMAAGDEAPPAEPSAGENVCETCGGTGRYGDAECADCDGTGRVIEAVGGG